MRSLGPMGRHRLPAAHPPRTAQPADEIEVATTAAAAEHSVTGASHVMTTLRGHTHDASTSDPAIATSDERNHPSHRMLGKRKRQPWKAKPCFTDLARLCFDIDNWPATAEEARLLVCSTTCCLILLRKILDLRLFLIQPLNFWYLAHTDRG